MPAPAEKTMIMLVMPITIPRVVKAVRTLFENIDLRAVFDKE
jgi:hypothetical protein